MLLINLFDIRITRGLSDALKKATDKMKAINDTFKVKFGHARAYVSIKYAIKD